MATKPKLIKQVAKAGPLPAAPVRPMNAPVTGATQARLPKAPTKPKAKVPKRPGLYAGGGSNDDGGDDNPQPVEPVPIF